MPEPLGFESFFEDQRSKVFGAMCLVTGNRQEAEEITQDAFLRAFRFLGGFRGDRKFGSWLFSITRNCAMDAMRRRDMNQGPSGCLDGFIAVRVP